MRRNAAAAPRRKQDPYRGRRRVTEVARDAEQRQVPRRAAVGSV
jgi:hypothetical protein